MLIDRILLLNSPIYKDGEKNYHAANFSCYPPLGLVTIATAIKNAFPEIDLKIIDGELISMECVKNEMVDFKPDIIGISTLTTTYINALYYAEFAKNIGIKYVVLGNDHASFFPKLILQNREFIDYIIVGDNGKTDFLELVRALNNGTDEFLSTHNLFGKCKGAIRHGLVLDLPIKETNRNLNDIPDFNLLGIDYLKRYWDNYNKDFGFFHSDYKRPLTINNARGCSNFLNKCLYCHIYDLKPNWGHAEFFWANIYQYYQRFKANLFFEVCDNFGGMKYYHKELIKTMPKWFIESDIELIVYTRAFDIYTDKDIIDNFKLLHVKQVNIGLESGSDYALQSFRKGHPRGIESDINKYAVEFLTEANIQLHTSFILGCLGEDYETILATKKFIEWIKRFNNIVAIEVSSLYPVPNSPSWDLLIGNKNSQYFKKDIETLFSDLGLNNYKKVWKEANAFFSNNDIIDVKYASKLWLDNFTKLSASVIENEIIELNSLIVSEYPINTGAYL